MVAITGKVGEPPRGAGLSKSTNHAKLLVVLWTILFLGGKAVAGADVEIFFGVPVNVDSSIRMTQEGSPDLRFDGEFESRPFKVSPFYALRVNFFSDGSAWALDLTHHKLFLKNPPSDVQSFSITHGFNLITAQRRWARGNLFLSLGAGVVMAHPESTVRGRRFDEDFGLAGYKLTGPVLSTGLGTRLPMPSGLFLSLEARAVGAHVEVPIDGGEAVFDHVSFQFLWGFGFGL